MTQVLLMQPGLARRIGQTVRNIATRARQGAERQRRIAQIERELNAHDDRGLADLGIARCDIRRIARES